MIQYTINGRAYVLYAEAHIAELYRWLTGARINIRLMPNGRFL